MAIALQTPSSFVRGLDENRFQLLYEFLQAHGYCGFQIRSRPRHPPPMRIQSFLRYSLINSSLVIEQRHPFDIFSLDGNICKLQTDPIILGSILSTKP